MGYGRVGRRIASALRAQDIPFVVAEENRDLVEKLRAEGIPAVSGDASDPAVLIQAHIARARLLVVATPDTMDAVSYTHLDVYKRQGLHFSIDELLSVRKLALPGAVVQIAVATLLGMSLAFWWGWSTGAALVFGLSLSVASTVVLLRALETRNQLDTFNGRVAVGWLVVEDLVMVLVLVLLPPVGRWLAGDGEQDMGSLWKMLGLTLLQVGGFVALMLLVGRRFFPWLLWHVQRTGSRELFTLCVVAAAVSIAFGLSLIHI